MKANTKKIITEVASVTAMLTFVFMFKNAVRGFIVLSLLLQNGLSHAQFTNTLMGQKPKPKVTKSEMDGDSAHYTDKPLTYREKHNRFTHSVWTEFDKYKSVAGKDSSYIMYSRMIGIKKAWSKAKRISKFPGDCSNSDLTLKPDAPAMGTNGEVYVCWAGPKGLEFQRSLDTGVTWLPEEKTLCEIKNGWDQEVDGLRTNGIPRIVVADSGEFRGRIFITWSDEKNGKKNKDIFLVYSDDKGEHWTDPILVTYRPNHKEQFNPAIAVQPVTGNVYLTYFDKQNYVDGKLCDLYLAKSANGGLKFDYYKLNDKPVMLDSNVASVRGLAFVPRSQEVKAIWSQIGEDNMLSIYSAMLTDSTISDYLKKEAAHEITIEKSMRFTKKMKVSFDLKEDAQITFVLTKPLEPAFSQVIAQSVPLKKGANTFVIDSKKSAIEKGNYVLTLYYNNRNSFVWITEK